MKKKHFRIVRIMKGEDTPCKECGVYWVNNFYCTGNCKLIRRWKTKPYIAHRPYGVIPSTYIDGYIYKAIK